ncbi:MAG: SDR family oxidoreductase [Bacteroidota bacterium]
MMRNEKTIVIGGSSGIGKAVATLASKKEAEVTVTGLTESKLDMLKSDLPNVKITSLDVNDEEAVNAFINGFDTIDHLYIAAGSTKLGSILDGTVEEQMAPIDLRLKGSVYVIRAAAKKMNTGGSITFTGGLSTDRPVSGAWVSGIGTAVAEQLARVMALELAPIRFNAVSPGWTDTPMWDTILGEGKQEVFEQVAEKQPVKRLATPNEVAQAVLFFMENKSVTGEIIHVDGGARLV